PKFKRPRAPFYLESWCPWIRGQSAYAVYLYSPHSVEGVSPKYSGEMMSRLRMMLGKGGFYHSFFMRKFWKFIGKRVATMSGNPDIPSHDSIGGGIKEEAISGEFLVIAGEGSGIKFANRLAEMSGSTVLLIQTKSRNFLEKEAGERVRSGVLTINAVYLGKFEDGMFAVNREERKIYRISSQKVVFFPAIRDAFPIFENNDLPGIVSSDLAIQLIFEYSALKEVDKVSVLADGQRGISVAEEISKKKDVRIIAPLTKKDGLSEVESKDIVFASEIMARGYPNIRELEIVHPGKERIHTDLLVSAITGFPDIESLLQMGGSVVFSVSIGRPTIATKRGAVDGIDGVYLLGRASGTPNSLVNMEIEIFSKFLSGEKLSGNEEEEMERIDRAKGLVPLNEATIREPPEFFLARNIEGMKFICPCQDVTLSDVVKAYDLGYKDIERIKRFTALGTGSCQGRICRFSTAMILSYLRSVSLESLGTFRQRPPLEPIEIEFLS
ncbi:MAG: (2Fe-2S)-binding protein, partial [Fervidicoccaceae archaeon]